MNETLNFLRLLVANIILEINFTPKAVEVKATTPFMLFNTFLIIFFQLFFLNYFFSV